MEFKPFNIDFANACEALPHFITLPRAQRPVRPMGKITSRTAGFTLLSVKPVS
jgi:hypothetical protein